MEEIEITVPGFEGRNFKAIDRGIFKPLEIHLDGKKIDRKNFKYIVTDNQGTDVEIKFNHGFLVDMGSALTIKDKTIHLREPLKWYEYLFAGWPILMMFIGGAIGGGLGAAAASINIKIFRSRINIFLKYLLTFSISIIAFIIWTILAVMINQKFRPQHN